MLVVVSVIYLITMYFLGANKKDDVLGVISSPTVTFSPTPTPLETPSASPSASPTIKPTYSAIPTASPSAQPTPKGASSSEINGFIDRFSSQYGIDPNVLRYIAICESGFRSNAENAGYVGLYQFGPVTWKNLRQEFGEDINIDLRYSAEESVQTASYALSKGKSGIWPNCIP